MTPKKTICFGDSGDKELRLAFTLIEVLVVISIIAVLLGLLLPAVHKVRESANRTKCLHNLRQIGLAAVNFESERNVFPPAGTTAFGCPQLNIPPNARHSWATLLLPYLDQQPLFDLYHFDKNWAAPDNQPAVSVVVSTFLCPSDIWSSPTMYHAANQSQNGRIAYKVWTEISPALRDDGGMGYCDNLENNVYSTAYHGVMRMYGIVEPTGSPPQKFLCRRTDVKDGLTQTIMISEVSGRPKGFARRSALPASSTNAGNWANENSDRFCGSKDDGTPFGQCAVNCNNIYTMFSFHPGGAASLFADGSVRFLNENIPIRSWGA